MLVMLTVCSQTVNISSMTNTSCCEHSIKTPDDGQKVCPKHVELFNQNKVEKLCILLACILRMIDLFLYFLAVYDFAESVWCAVRIWLHIYIRDSQDMLIKICRTNSLHRNGTLHCKAVVVYRYSS